MNVKWLRRLTLVDAPVHSREETSQYTDLMPNSKARQFTFYMVAKSIITAPSGGRRAMPLTDLSMPNRDGFIGDARPDVQDAGCIRDCASQRVAPCAAA